MDFSEANPETWNIEFKKRAILFDLYKHVGTLSAYSIVIIATIFGNFIQIEGSRFFILQTLLGLFISLVISLFGCYSLQLDIEGAGPEPEFRTQRFRVLMPMATLITFLAAACGMVGLVIQRIW